MATDERRKHLAAVLDKLPADRAGELRARLEKPEPPPLDFQEGVHGGYVVAETVIASQAGDIFTKAAFMDGPDVWRYGLFAPEDCMDSRRAPSGEPFWKSKRSWKGDRDPDLDRKV